MKSIILTLLTLGVLIVLGYSGYTVWLTYYQANQTREGAALQAAQQEASRQAIAQVMRSQVQGLSERDIKEGFWYAYPTVNGQEDLYYFDIDTLAQRGLTDAQIQELAADANASRIVEKTAMREIPNDQLPENFQFHNSVYSFGETGNAIALREALQKQVANGKFTANDLFRLAYLLELEGKYTERDAIHTLSCKEFNTYCEGEASITITGSVVTKNGTPVQGAAISILSKSSNPVAYTDEKGEFVIGLSVNELEKVRLGAYKRNFSEGVGSVVVATTKRETYDIAPIVVESPINIVTVDTEKKTITGDTNIYNADGSIVVHTSVSTYEIPTGAVTYEDGRPYSGVFDIYLYEFSKSTVPEGLTTVDTFDEVTGYAGDLMKSFGMPYIQFFTPEGEELYVLSSLPMKLTYQIPNMKELYDNSDQIYTALTDADMQKLVDKTLASPGGYPIDRAYLIENQLVKFPAFWVFDRRSGVWQNVGIRVNNIGGEIETPFYTVNVQ